MVVSHVAIGEEFEDFGDDFELEDSDIQVLDVEFTQLQAPAVSDNLLGTDTELDNILDSINLEDCDLEDFEVLING